MHTHKIDHIFAAAAREMPNAIMYAKQTFSLALTHDTHKLSSDMDNKSPTFGWRSYMF